MFICLEGIDASGKHTQALRIADSLGGEVIAFPDYRTPSGHIIRGYLRRLWRALPIEQSLDAGINPYSKGVETLNSEIFQLLQLANKVDCVRYIEGKIKLGTHLIADRYWPSSWVYGRAEGLDGDMIMQLNDSLPQPDLFFLLDVDVEESFTRRPDRQDVFEARAELMSKASKLYRELWLKMDRERKPGKWVIIDGKKDTEQVWAQIESNLPSPAGVI